MPPPAGLHPNYVWCAACESAIGTSRLGRYRCGGGSSEELSEDEWNADVLAAAGAGDAAAGASGAGTSQLLGELGDPGNAAGDDADDCEDTANERIDLDDPGLLPEAERLRRLTRWAVNNARLDPRVAFGPFDWELMQTSMDAQMSVGTTKNHLQGLHELNCGALGLTLRTRDDISIKLQSLLDGNLANRSAAASAQQAAAGSLRFFTETVQVWNGVHGAGSAMVTRELYMRELVPLMLAMYLDPHMYGRMRTRYHAPTVGGGACS